MPDAVRSALRGGRDHHRRQQRPAFPLLTVDDAGFPHVCLLAADQIDVHEDGERLGVSVSGRGTTEFLRVRGRATLIVIEGEEAHYLKCQVVASVSVDGRTGFVLAVGSHKADSAGVDLTPIEFSFSEELATAEDWSRDLSVLRALRNIED